MHPWRTVAMLALGTASACGQTAPEAATTTTRDSLGILIVDNEAPSRTGAPWTLDTVAVLDLGSQSADPHHEFSGFVLPVRLADGRVVVANGGSNELRMFGPDGKWQKSVGRQGSGPGEFESLGWVDAGTGDTLRTYDWSLQRFSVFSSDGAFQRTVSLQSAGEASSPRPAGVLGDGRLIVQRQNTVTLNAKPGAGRDTVPLQVYDATGSLSDSLGRFRGPEHLIQTGKGSVSVSSLPFGKEFFVAVRESRLYVGSSDGPEFLVIKPDGLIERIVRWSAAPVAVTPADIDAYIAAAAEEFPAGREARRDRFVLMLREAPFPKWKPSHAGLLAGPEGSIWVRRYTEPDKSPPITFEVFDSAGRWLGPVTMPAGYAPTQITPGFVAGTWSDADDVKHVRVYRLVPRP